MTARSWFPAKRQVSALLAAHGWREPLPEAAMRIGGRVFFRNHGSRLDMAYVFAWSNFNAAARDRTKPCSLIVRLTCGVTESEAQAWRAAPQGRSITLPFDGAADWDSARSAFAAVVMPLVEASPSTRGRGQVVP